ncbi:zinc-dependent alcohol dehydrogenase family protein [Geitlerinema sp. PCC 9228]|uniref:zinc-dependent alcohol dehydrogenase family protein n=1 Tax=Geitlerinema sp. PCC 9228 TaxID=111611 RepID=UPI0008F9A831|nr:zinc-dependent alcohol dehydrogenase family protein [Geitlerinema sp. PCC 9228]
MKAVVMTAAGEPEVLQLQSVPQPQIQIETQMLVQLRAAGVNPIDTKVRQRGTFYPDQEPAILGCDGAGVVAEVGSAVQNFQVGDEVYFFNGGLGGPTGNYAEYAVVDARFAAKKPRSLSFAEAAAAPLVLITAWESLYDRGRLQAGQTTLVHAGAGGVGHVAVQLAKLQGASVATTVGTQEKADFIQSLGADLPILYKEKDFVEAVLAWTQQEGVDLAFDTVGGKVLEQSFPAVKVYGDVVTLLEPAADTSWKVARKRNQRLSLELMLTPMTLDSATLRQDQTKILNQCARLIDAGKLKICLNHTFPLEQASQAHRLLGQGSMLGKIALEIGQSAG